MDGRHHQIGEVAERVGLSLRTIRYYEEVGLVMPSGRTEGGFRLYTETDIERLMLIKALKPVGMSLESMQDLLVLSDRIAAATGLEASEIEDRFHGLIDLARQACTELDARVRQARGALDQLELRFRGVGSGLL